MFLLCFFCTFSFKELENAFLPAAGSGPPSEGDVLTRQPQRLGSHY